MRGALAAIAASAAVGLSACGGERERNPNPAFSTEISNSLTAHAGDIAALVEIGDECGAEERARELQRKVRNLSEEGRIHRKLREPLLSGVDAVMARIQCVVVEQIEVPVEPPPPPPDEKQEEKAGNGNQGQNGPTGGGGSNSGPGGGRDALFTPPEREPQR